MIGSIEGTPEQRMVNRFFRCRSEKEARLLRKAFFATTKPEQRNVIMGILGVISGLNSVPDNTTVTIAEMMASIRDDLLESKSNDKVD